MAITIDAVVEAFDKAVARDPQIRGLMERVTKGTATYADASRLSSLTGQKLGRILTDSFGVYELPVENIRTVLQRTCLQNYNIVADAVEQVQESLNKKAGIGLKPKVPKYNRDRVDGIASEIEDRGYDAVSRSLPAQIENQSMAIVDDAVRENADFHYNAGLSPKITRISDSNCCKWCDDLAGTYDYPCDSEVYRRHENCRCVVEYDPGTGKYQDVYSKRWR